MDSDEPGRIALIRHGETRWSRQRRHTGRSDIPLDYEGRKRATALRPVLAALSGIDAAGIMVSPLRRARETATLAGVGDRAEICDDLLEWDYGAYEGRRRSRFVPRCRTGRCGVARSRTERPSTRSPHARTG